jgi:hypothetical protein
MLGKIIVNRSYICVVKIVQELMLVDVGATSKWPAAGRVLAVCPTVLCIMYSTMTAVGCRLIGSKRIGPARGCPEIFRVAVRAGGLHCLYQCSAGSSATNRETCMHSPSGHRCLEKIFSRLDPATNYQSLRASENILLHITIPSIAKCIPQTPPPKKQQRRASLAISTHFLQNHGRGRRSSPWGCWCGWSLWGLSTSARSNI